MTNQDVTDENVVCRRLSELIEVAKVVTYTGRALKALEDIVKTLPPSPI